MISGPSSFYSIRFLLGLTEAGFFPGVAFLLSQWFPAEYPARMLAGWQSMFMIEGLPATVLGFVTLRLLADQPSSATWLTAEERVAVEDRIAAEPRYKEVRHFWAALKDPRVLLLAVIQFGFTTGSYGVGIWLPQIIKPHFHSNLTVGFVSAGPYLIAAIAMLLWAGWVDRNGKRIGNLLLTCLLATMGLLLSVVFDAFWI